MLLDVVSTEADPCFSWFVETIVNCLPVQIAMAADAIKVSKTNLLEKKPPDGSGSFAERFDRAPVAAR